MKKYLIVLLFLFPMKAMAGSAFTQSGGGSSSSNPAARRAMFFLYTSTMTAGDTASAGVAQNRDTQQNYDFWSGNGDTASASDVVVNGVVLDSGTYTFNVLGITNADAAIVDWKIDGTAVVSGQDWYSGGLVYNVIKKNTITITTSGYHTVTMAVNGHNASSSAYQWRISTISIYTIDGD